MGGCYSFCCEDEYLHAVDSSEYTKEFDVPHEERQNLVDSYSTESYVEYIR
jgi:hypothetical protein